jgi:hypothetical protein
MTELKMVKPAEALETRIDRAAALTEERRRIEAELSGLKKSIEAELAWKDGCATAHAFGRHWEATAVRKLAEKWDQDALDGLRAAMGDADFFKAFKFTYAPREKKALDAALEYSPHAAGIEACRTVKPAATSFTFKPMEG